MAMTRKRNNQKEGAYMEARATANTVLTAPIKSRLVINLIRGKKVSEADNILNNLNKKSARLIRKVLISAVANAENNLGLEKDKLYVKEAYINEGPVLKRIRFGSRSHIDRHDKRTSHITVVVGYKTK
jgi:large subunit ribosomal protein L22